MTDANNQIRLQLQRGAFELSLDLSLPATGITVLFGASGSGKTTLLRCVAGLERAQQGLVRIGGEVWQDEAAKHFLPTWRRALGYVFQEASLFEHLTVLGNLQYGLKRTVSRTMRAASNQVLDAAITLLGIDRLLDRSPTALSGGERQRVAIARALATQPRLLLLDEPLAALDHARKQEILPWLERLRDELSVPMLYVTHSADELARLADHVVLLDRGRATAAGPAAQALSTINSPLLIGEDVGALLTGRVAERDSRWHLCRVAFDGGSLWLRDSGLPLGHRVRLRVLARDVSIATQAQEGSSIQNQLPCVIEASAADAVHPSQVLVRVRLGGEEGAATHLLARITGRAFETLNLRPGQPAWIQVKSVALLA
ncbi:molybdenum ABC transporter ATP-binding protein [Roseateles sp.]|uniref:molybdenum ABC transporter ATP-binding protein n=1 Tax=Roseateles sp. TaxID=1971397 RepID=UPI00286BBCE8|nr:molybdenum ABC transporter ATP-binding protein [Roseateles sp.]